MPIKRVLAVLTLVFLSFILIPGVFAVSDDYKIIDMKGDANFVAYLTSNNEIYVLGSNANGQLGRGFKDNGVKMNPTSEPIIGNVRTFTAGKNNYIVAITNDNRVFGWGSNQYGQIGQGVILSSRDNDILSPTSINIPSDSEFIQVVAGARHTMVLDSNGDVWVFGDNSFGQLGINEEVSNRTKVFGNPTKIDPEYFNNIKVVEIAASEYTSYALLENGDVYAWGTDYQGQLVIGDDHNIPLLGTSEKMINYPVKNLFTNVKKIQARSENVGVMTYDNQVFIAGSNTLSQLGISTFNALFSNVPVEITEKYTLDGTEINSPIVDFSIGGVANFIVLANGDLLSFGSGGTNELGYGVDKVTSEYRNLSSVVAPTKVTFYEPIEIEEVENPSTSIYKTLIPVDKTKEINVDVTKIITSIGTRTIVLDNEGRYWSFGNNINGLVASGNLSTVDAPVLSTLFKIEFYDEEFITKNYLIEPLIGVILTIILFGAILVKLELNYRDSMKREKKFIELLNSNQITKT